MMENPAHASTHPEGTPRAPSRLHSFCGGVMEACWLAIAILVPLAYSPHAVSGFQPFKIAIFRVLALVLGLAWIVQAIEGMRLPRSAPTEPGSRLQKALWISLAVLTISHIASAAFSVDPAQTVAGFFAARAGTLSFLSGAVLCAALAVHLRTAQQVERLVTAIILPGIPLALYAIAQRAGFDPLPHYKADSRVFSLAGHPIFLAASLGMTAPFALWRAVQGFRHLADRRPAAIAVAALWIAVSVAFVVVIVLTGSRGALLATIGTAAFFGIALGAAFHRRALIVWTLAACAIAIGILALISMPNGPFASFTKSPIAQRYSSTLPLAGKPDVYRDDIWAQIPKVMLARETFTFPDGRADWPQALRTTIGFGPETLTGVLPRCWSWRGPTGRTENSFHNLLWDAWYGTGALGAFATLGVFVAALILGCRTAGFLTGKGTRVAAGLGILTCAAGAIVPAAIFGIGYLGAGLQIGIAAGTGVALAASFFLRGKRAPQPAPEDWERRTLVVAATAAIVMHLAETATAFPVAGSSVLFWASMGLIASPAMRLPRREEIRGDEPASSAEPWVMPLLSAAVMASLAFSFVQDLGMKARTPFEAVWNSLLQLSESDKPSHLFALVLIPSLALLSLFGAAEALGRKGGAIAAMLRIAACGAVAFAVSAMLKAPTISGLGLSASASGTTADALALVPKVAWMLAVCAALCSAFVVLLTLACKPRVGGRTPFATWRGATVAVLGIAVALFTFRPIAWDYTVADAIADRGISLRHHGRLESGVVLLEKAASLDPINFFHRTDTAETCVNLARIQNSPAEFSAWMRRAEASLLAAHARSPLNGTSAPLGRLHFDWAMLPGDAKAKAEHAASARRFYDEALRHDPTAIHLWMESGWLDEVLLREPERAAQQFARADALSDVNSPEGWGAFFAERSFEPIHPALKRLAARRGIVHYEKELRRAEQLGRSPFALRIGKGTLHRNLRELDLALEEFRQAREVATGDERWKADIMLAYTHADLGDKVSAQLSVISAFESAPASEHANLEKLRAELVR